jgi:hypothetical protein
MQVQRGARQGQNGAPFNSRCPRCGVPFELICLNENCEKRYKPRLWLFNPDGTLKNRACSRHCKEALSWKRRHQKEGNRLTDEQLEAARLDMAWEARNGIMDRVACRACGRLVKRLGGRKLVTHLQTKHTGMTLREYQTLYPCSPKGRAAGRQGKSGRGVIDDYVAGAELLACRADPEWEVLHGITDFVVCRECGTKMRSRLSLSDSDSKWGCRHLQLQHGMTMKQYLAKHAGAPIFHRSGLEKERARAEIIRKETSKLKDQVQAGVLRRMPRSTGRRKLAPKETRAFEIGSAVEDLIPKAEMALKIIAGLPPRERSFETLKAKLMGMGFVMDEEVRLAQFESTPKRLARSIVAGRNLVGPDRRPMTIEAVERSHQRYLQTRPTR